MNQEVRILIGIGVVTALIIGGAVWLSARQATSSVTSHPELLVRADSHRTGSASAPVTVVEFGDFQCPSCGAAYPLLKQMLTDYNGQVSLVFRNFPLTQIHPNALIGAEAAEAAGAQGKYWEMHDMLFQNQNEWADSTTPLDSFVKYAQSLHLDIDAFKQAMSSHAGDALIQRDQNDGNALGVTGTPTLFLNGHEMDGVPDYASLKAELDALPKK